MNRTPLPESAVESIFRSLEVTNPEPSQSLTLRWLSDVARDWDTTLNGTEGSQVKSKLVQYSSRIAGEDLKRVAGLQLTTASHDGGNIL